jgi:hypothetical protein
MPEMPALSLPRLFLLQDVYFESSGDRNPWVGTLVITLLGAFFLVLIIVGIAKNRKNAAPRQFSGLAMRKIARAYGLDTPQRKSLERVFREDAVADPNAAMLDADLLDTHFKRAYHRIESSVKDDAEAQDQLSQLFSVRNAIESAQLATEAAPPSHQIHRRFRRMRSSIDCTVTAVKVTETKAGRKLTRKMTLDKRSYSGAIVDISIGGCSISSDANIPPGARVKIEFSIGDSPRMAALGKVLRVNRKGTEATMHAKFIKIPRRTHNAINALVFKYAED